MKYLTVIILFVQNCNTSLKFSLTFSHILLQLLKIMNFNTIVKINVAESNVFV